MDVSNVLKCSHNSWHLLRQSEKKCTFVNRKNGLNFSRRLANSIPQAARRIHLKFFNLHLRTMWKLLFRTFFSPLCLGLWKVFSACKILSKKEHISHSYIRRKSCCESSGKALLQETSKHFLVAVCVAINFVPLCKHFLTFSQCRAVHAKLLRHNIFEKSFKNRFSVHVMFRQLRFVLIYSDLFVTCK